MSDKTFLESLPQYHKGEQEESIEIASKCFPEHCLPDSLMEVVIVSQK
jgi:hypothetical protein